MVSNQQFRLKWNNHRNTVLQEFETLLHNNSFVDCTIGADGKYLKAHKIVLSACSPYLQNVFSEHFDKHPVILLKDVSFKELKCMIDYMYCGEVNISECELPSFLRTAQSLKIKGLAEDLNDYDSSSDNEQADANAFSESSRTVEANVEIHDDEPPVKKSAPSLISASVVNNSLAGRKRKTPNPVPIAGKISASNQSQNKSGAATTTTPNSSKPADVRVPSSADSENAERPTSATTNENCVEKSENGDSSKQASQSESHDQKSRTEVKEEPVDTDADNEDNSSYECANNPCDDSDPLNDDSESNCANSGNKFGEVSIASVSSYNENDANDNRRSSITKVEISALETRAGKIEPVEVEEEQLSENNMGELASQFISETDEDISNSIIVEVKSLTDDFDSSFCDESIETIAAEMVASAEAAPMMVPSEAFSREPLSRRCKELIRWPVEFDVDELPPRKSGRKRRIAKTPAKSDKDGQPPLRKILPAPAKQTAAPRSLLPMPAEPSGIASASVKYTVAAQSYPPSRDDVMAAPANPSISYQLVNLPGTQPYPEISATDLPQIVGAVEEDDNLGHTNDVRSPNTDMSGLNSQFLVLNAGNPVVLLNSNAPSSSAPAPVYGLSTQPKGSIVGKMTRRLQQVSILPRPSSKIVETEGADSGTVRKLKETFVASKRWPTVSVTKTKLVNQTSPMTQFRRIAPQPKPPTPDEYRCAKCFELFHSEHDALNHPCSAATPKKRCTIARVVRQYQ